MFILDPTFFHPGSRIRMVFLPGSRIRITEFKYFNPKKLFLNSKKYDPGCSSRIQDPDPCFLPIPDIGSRGQNGTRSRIRIRNTGFNYLYFRLKKEGRSRTVGTFQNSSWIIQRKQGNTFSAPEDINNNLIFFISTRTAMYVFDWCCSFYLRTILRVSFTVINITHTLDVALDLFVLQFRKWCKSFGYYLMYFDGR
jgi:hypothetical protein